MCSGSEAGSYLRLLDFVYHSILGSRVTQKKKSFGFRGKGCLAVIGDDDAGVSGPVVRWPRLVNQQSIDCIGWLTGLLTDCLYCLVLTAVTVLTVVFFSVCFDCLLTWP